VNATLAVFILLHLELATLRNRRERYIQQIGNKECKQGLCEIDSDWSDNFGTWHVKL
jgi:hypothetical protein